MNVKELKRKIENLPDHMNVFMDERLTQEEFTYGLVNSCEVKKIPFMESEGHDVLAEDDCLVLSEE